MSAGKTKYTMKYVVGRLREVASQIEDGAHIENATEIFVPDKIQFVKSLVGIRTISVTWRPLPITLIQGCRKCEYCLGPFDPGNKEMRLCCNHPRNIQPHVRNFQRQKPLTVGYFPIPPAWCKKEEDEKRMPKVS